ncbi:MAG: sugar phosphate isomerase/epimerase [Anaerolineae bacterium]|nr:sugar phosphate isomerase/epimerase [Anaerolineae bacterium]
MPLAIQEDMLPGKTALERFENARALGFAGVEVWGKDLTPRVPELAEAVEQTGVVISAVNHGRQGRLLDPDRDERERALAEFRQSVVDGVDLGAAGVILVPHFNAPTLPDLTPYKSVVQLEYEMLHNHLRTLSDYVYAIGIDLYIEPVNRYETHFLNTLADAVKVRRKIKDHPHVKLTADLFHMAMEEQNTVAALREYANDLGYIHVADSNRRLPGQGMTDFAAVGVALCEVGYTGWIALECGRPGHNSDHAPHYMSELPAALELLRRVGLGN